MMNSILSNGQKFLDVFPNTHIDVKLEGWPATTSIVAVCLSCVGIYAIKAKTNAKTNDSEIST